MRICICMLCMMWMGIISCTASYLAIRSSGVFYTQGFGSSRLHHIAPLQVGSKGDGNRQMLATAHLIGAQGVASPRPGASPCVFRTPFKAARTVSLAPRVSRGQHAMLAWYRNSPLKVAPPTAPAAAARGEDPGHLLASEGERAAVGLPQACKPRAALLDARDVRARRCLRANLRAEPAAGRACSGDVRRRGEVEFGILHPRTHAAPAPLAAGGRAWPAASLTPPP